MAVTMEIKWERKAVSLMERRTNIRWWLLVAVSLGVMLAFSAPYLAFDPDASRVDVSSSAWHYPLLVAHILTALVALATGFAQFSERLRSRKPAAHRYAGRAYVASVFVSGILAFALAAFIADFAKAVSFLTLSALWLFTSWQGYRYARRRRFADHRRWMIRSFGLTLVAVSGRVLMPVLLLLYYALNGFSLPGGREGMVEEALNVNIWAGLVANFILVEWSVLRPAGRSKELS
ncbi:hypothetical protein J19TS2_62810 [Cohnella xylanilytica]|nr:hypothetical protein J19TS2_62810 [Cohnella xylanilytica]